MMEQQQQPLYSLPIERLYAFVQPYKKQRLRAMTLQSDR
jgi:hypothetical protein